MIPCIHNIKKTSDVCHIPSTAVISGLPAAEAEVFVSRMHRLPGRADFVLAPEGTEGAFVISVSLRNDDATGAEGYRLLIAPDHIEIDAADRCGAIWALTTLFELLRENGGESLPCGEMTDAPDLHWRGFLLDSCRHFFPVDTVKSMIEQCSLRKLNRLHWHLSDDQGFRIESHRFPNLNSHGSWWINPDGSTYGGFYTQDEIKDIVAFAQVRGVEIVPEIDMPGHVTAMVSSYPEISCSEEPVEIPSQGGIHPRILCAGKDSSVQFAKDLIDEVLPLFPFPYFHIGGDEAPKDEWKKCPHCQARMRALGLDDEEQLQAWFTERLTEHLESRGKTAIAWNEVLKSGQVGEKTVVQYWAEEGEEDNYCGAAFDTGRKCVYSNSEYLYLDSIPALLPLRKVYRVHPVVKAGTTVPADSLLGMECPLWAEMIATKERLEQMAFPRIFAMAQQAWGNAPDYEDFRDLVETEMSALDADGIAHFTMEEADVSGQAQLDAVKASWKPMIDGVLSMGDAAKGYLPIFYRLLHSKLADQFSEAVLADWFKELGL